MADVAALGVALYYAAYNGATDDVYRILSMEICTPAVINWQHEEDVRFAQPVLVMCDSY